MTDHQNNEHQLLAEDFVRFLEGTRPDSNCSSCGKSPAKWGLCATIDSEDEASTDTAVAYMQTMFHRFTIASADGVQRGLPTFGMYCTHCGHLEQVVAKVATEWLASHPREVSDAKS